MKEATGGARAQKIIMKFRTRLSLSLFLPIASWGVSVAAAQAAISDVPPAPVTSEQELIRLLESNASSAEKDAACEKLKISGNSRAVPALAELLRNEELSLSARNALESMPVPEAGAALLKALGQTGGRVEAGIIDSLGVRRETSAVPELLQLLYSQNLDVACASARALGEIGAEESIKPLTGALGRVGSPVREAVADGLLRCAARASQTGENSRGFRIYEALYRSEGKAKADFRVAAYGGMIRTSGQRGLSLLAEGLSGPAGPEQTAALSVASGEDVPGLTETITGVLPRVSPRLQAALIEVLARKGDAAASPAVLSLVSSSEPEVRVHALRALGPLGGPSAVPVLSEFAASGSPQEQAAARESLVELKRGKIGEMLIEQLATADPRVQAELVRALADRGDRRALPRLLYLAERSPDPVRHAAIRGLGLLVDQPELSALIRYVVTTTNEMARAEASVALNQACQHILAKHGRVEFDTLQKSILLGSTDARAALVPCCSGLVGPGPRLAVRSVLTDPDPRVHAAAVQALCGTIDPDLLEDVIVLSRTTKDQNVRQQTIIAGVRLATDQQTVKISKGQRLAALRALLASASQPEQKKLVLAGLGQVPDLEALRAVEASLEDPALQPEATLAAIKIATALPSTQVQEAMGVLSKASAAAPDAASRSVVDKALSQLQDSLDYITDWLVAGPYRQVGKDAAGLFDVVFPPETDNPQGVDWKPLPAGTDPKRPFILDLFKAVGGRQCVAYARTWLHAEKEEPMRLELGTDDGVRVWLNDKEVYAHNVTRALVPGEDKVQITLHPGWNMLLLKLTHGDRKWEFSARLVKPDGTHLENLQIEAAPKATAASNP